MYLWFVCTKCIQIVYKLKNKSENKLFSDIDTESEKFLQEQKVRTGKLKRTAAALSRDTPIAAQNTSRPAKPQKQCGANVI